jgi:hypothetical protein
MKHQLAAVLISLSGVLFAQEVKSTAPETEMAKGNYSAAMKLYAESAKKNPADASSRQMAMLLRKVVRL